MKEKIIDFLKDESGQTSTEYILLVAVMAAIIFKFKKTLSTNIEAATNKIFGEKLNEVINSIGQD